MPSFRYEKKRSEQAATTGVFGPKGGGSPLGVPAPLRSLVIIAKGAGGAIELSPDGFDRNPPNRLGRTLPVYIDAAGPDV